MGIKKLKDLIKKYAPSSITEVHLSNFRLKKVAIDVSLYLFRSKARANSRGMSDQWIVDFIYIVSCLRRHNIHPIFVYDSDAPVEKDQRKKERASKKQSLRERVNIISSLLEKYYKTEEVDNLLLDFVDDQKQELLAPGERVFNVSAAVSKLERLRSQIIDVSTADFILTRNLFDVLGVPYVEAATEAEKTCSFLCKKNIVDAVLTEDSDVLAYGTKFFLYNLDTVKNTVTQIDFERVLQEMNITEDGFLDLCILCGTDYNYNMKGIGPEKSYQMITQYGSIENIESITDHFGNKKHDVTVLNYIRCRELFKSMKEEKEIHFRHTGVPQMADISNFLEENGLLFNPKVVENAFSPEKINLID